jgi:hypothetical protein
MFYASALGTRSLIVLARFCAAPPRACNRTYLLLQLFNAISACFFLVHIIYHIDLILYAFATLVGLGVGAVEQGFEYGRAFGQY